jgi:undecaprenyl diphosphate synthase
MNNSEIPNHVVIIPDGNRRWAKQNNVPLELAYDRGIRKLGDVVKWADEAGVKILTFWGFSTENAKRGEKELNILFSLFERYLKRALEERVRENVRVDFFGRLYLFPKSIRDMMEKIKQKYSNVEGEKRLIFLMGYGGRQEIVDAVNLILKRGIKRVDENIFSNHLYTTGVPDPDLLIMTSGEQRLSGCLPWQTVYTELYFCKTLWPDFSKKDFHDALDEYKKRKRRFGK